MDKLRELLLKNGCSEDANMLEDAITVSDFSYKHLRDILVQLGTILEEIEIDSIYLATIRINYNYATIAIQLHGNEVKLIAYAKEGIIKQNTALKAVNKIKECINGLDNKKCKKKNSLAIGKLVILITILLVASVLLVGVMISCDSIDKYNVAANKFNVLVDEYNDIISKTSVDNIKGIPATIEKINIENNSFLEGFLVIVGKNSISKINADTKTIYQLVNQLEHSKKIANQITAPNSQWIEKRIKTVEGVTGTQAVLEMNNSDGLLNKSGGYTACIYFTYKKINSKTVPGESIVEKGTDAGGAIEVYATLQEAEARCEYLSGFDGTVLYSGSYAIVGTMVVRTSYMLTDEEQLDLTDKITQAITKVE